MNPFLQQVARYYVGVKGLEDYCFVFPNRRSGQFFTHYLQQCLIDAGKSLDLLLESLEMGLPEDICSIDLTDAIDHLGEITGETMREDLIDEIFGKFCMGK